MPGIDRKIIQHHLNINPECKTILQKQRVFVLERNKVVTEEVKKLLKANFIREVFYPDWLANVVMVKKSNGKWRMCKLHRPESGLPKRQLPLAKN